MRCPVPRSQSLSRSSKSKSGLTRGCSGQACTFRRAASRRAQEVACEQGDARGIASAMALQLRTCPGCGLDMPLCERTYDRKFHASAECWSVFEEVLASELQNPVPFGQVHQLTVDTYAVQHAGGRHPDKSVCVHLVGLHLMLERGVAPAEVPARLQRLAIRANWPHLDPPEERASLTVRDVALADSPLAHARRVREWAAEVWRAWSRHHDVDVNSRRVSPAPRNGLWGEGRRRPGSGRGGPARGEMGGDRATSSSPISRIGSCTYRSGAGTHRG
jgi:hypothetical protein